MAVRSRSDTISIHFVHQVVATCAPKRARQSSSDGSTCRVFQVRLTRVGWIVRSSFGNAPICVGQNDLCTFRPIKKYSGRSSLAQIVRHRNLHGGELWICAPLPRARSRDAGSESRLYHDDCARPSVLRPQITVATRMHERRQWTIMDDTTGVIDFVRYRKWDRPFS